MTRLPELTAVVAMFAFLFAGTYVVGGFLGLDADKWLRWAVIGSAVGLWVNLWWESGAVREDVRLLRIQMNRLTHDTPTEVDRVRLENDSELETLTPYDLKTILQTRHLKWANEHPEEAKALERDLASAEARARTKQGGSGEAG